MPKKSDTEVVLEELVCWLLTEGNKTKYTGFELEYGIERGEVLDKIDELRAALPKRR